MGYVFQYTSRFCEVPILLANRTKLLLFNYLLAALTNIALNYFLIPWFGILGAAFATGLSFLFLHFLNWESARLLGDFVFPKKIVAKGFILALVIFSPFKLWEISSIPLILIGCALAMFLYSAACRFFGLIFKNDLVWGVMESQGQNKLV